LNYRRKQLFVNVQLSLLNFEKTPSKWVARTKGACPGFP